MSEEKFLTIRDASLMLGISEKEVVDLVESNQLPAYKVGGVYLRFKREQIETFKKSQKPVPNKNIISRKHAFSPQAHQESGFKEKISDFFYFNDFYILAILIILLLLFIIFRGY